MCVRMCVVVCVCVYVRCRKRETLNGHVPLGPHPPAVGTSTDYPSSVVVGLDLTDPETNPQAHTHTHTHIYTFLWGVKRRK